MVSQRVITSMNVSLGMQMETSWTVHVMKMLNALILMDHLSAFVTLDTHYPILEIVLTSMSVLLVVTTAKMKRDVSIFLAEQFVSVCYITLL